MITLYPGEIPEGGLHLSGSLEEDIFQLDPADEIQPAGPTVYDLRVFRSDDFLLAQGRIEAPFTLRCVVCLDPFPFTSRIDDYLAEFELEGDETIDLAERIREDLLLALSAYPHCDEGGEPGRVCPLAGRFAHPEPENTSGKPSAWDALDGLGSRGESGD